MFMDRNKGYKYLVATRCYTYNHAPYIEDTLNGFALQEVSFPVVYIIVDDASTDGEPEVIRRWATENLETDRTLDLWRDMPYGQLAVANLKGKSSSSFVILLLSENHYQTGKGLKRFDYITEWFDNAPYQALCEGDDYWIDPLKLKKQVDIMESDSSLGLCYTKCKDYFQSEHRLASKSWGGSSVSFEEFMISNRVPTPTVMYRSDLFWRYQKEVIPDKKWLMGDYPMWIFISHESSVSFLPVVTAIYRVLDNSASHSKKMEDKIRFASSQVDIIKYFNKKYHYSYTDKELEEMRWRNYIWISAIYNKFFLFIKYWVRGIMKRPLCLFKKSSYKPFLFFVFPKLRVSRPL